MSNYFEIIPDGKCFVADVEYIHRGRPELSCAYELNEKIELRLNVPRAMGSTSATLEIYDGVSGGKISEYTAEICDFDNTKDVFSFIIKLERGLYFLKPSLCVFGNRIYGRRRGRKVIFDGEGNMLQLTVSNFEFDEPKAMYGGMIYHIFVDRFCRGGECEVPEYNVLVPGEWEQIPEYPAYPGAPLKNNTLYGGTLYGIVDRLDYIASLGASAIYLSPIFTSVSNHKYDTADYMSVDPAFGGDEALELLISEADKRNIKIILDGVFNHTGSDSIYFNKNGRFDSLGAYQSKESPYYSWYDFKSYPEKYTCWWDIDILPRINPDILSLRAFLSGESGVVAKYRDMGVYGFRLDVADELSDDFIKSCKACLSRNGESVLYGEVWEDASNKIAYDKRKTYFLGDELDGVMNYPLREALISYLKLKDISGIRYVVEEVFANAPARILNAQMNFLGTHDTVRILTALSDIDMSGRANTELSMLKLTRDQREISLKRLKALYTTLATLPGVPTVFYGDEVGLEGFSDPFNRMPYPYGKEDFSLLDHFRRIGEIRRNNPVYEVGRFNLLRLDEDVFSFERADSHNSYVTVLNISNSDFTLSCDLSFTSLLSKRRGSEHKISPMSADVFKVKRNTTLDFRRNWK